MKYSTMDTIFSSPSVHLEENEDAEKLISWGNEVHKSTSPNDIKYRRSININFKDGSSMFFNNAFLLRYDDVIFWFTQIHGWGFSHKDKLESFKELTSKNIPIEELQNVYSELK